MKRIILEMGAGNDLYGEDYTKAARRAVQDALHHSSLTLFRSLGYRHEDMQVKVTIGVQKPEQVDIKTVKAVLPYGQPRIRVVHGGLDIAKPPKPGGAAADTDKTVIANAAVNVYFDMEPAPAKAGVKI